MRRSQPTDQGLSGPGRDRLGVSTFATPTTPIANSPIVGADFTITGTTGIGDAQPDFKVAVTGYTVDTVDMNTPQVLHLTLQNQGTKTIGLGSLIPFFILDDQGLPLYFSSISYTPTTLAPDQTLAVTRNAVEFDGAATRIRFHVEATHP